MSLKQQVKNGKTTFSASEFRKGLKADESKKQDGYHTIFDLNRSSQSIIIGLDPDVDSSGVGVYDAKKNKVLFYDVVALRYIYEWINDFKREMGNDAVRIIARLELTNKSVAEGISRKVMESQKMKGVSQAAIEKAYFSRIWNSARNAQVGQEIKKELERAGIDFECIRPNHRKNISNDPQMIGRPGQVLEAYTKRQIVGGKWRFFPTKPNKEQMSYLWPHLEGDVKTSEEMDALMLALPERVFNRMK
jgi:hypothetical protein